MSLVYDRTDSGLLVARNGAEGATVAAALKEHDRDLRLVPQFSEAIGQYWAVYRYAGSERPAELVCVWVTDDGKEAKPLSYALVDRVKELDRGGRTKLETADEGNARRRREIREQADRDAADATVEWVKHGKKSHVLPRSVGLRQARSRTGYHDKKGR